MMKYGQEALESIREDLKSGDYVILEGDPLMLMTLENSVYPPGTKKNGHYISVNLIGDKGATVFFLGRKCKELREWLNMEREKFWKYLWSVTFYTIGFRVKGVDPKSLEEVADIFMKDVASLIGLPSSWKKQEEGD